MSTEHTYPARLLRVIDGDTVVVEVDLGLGVRKVEHVRLRGCNCPERNTHIAGKHATEATATWWATRNGSAYITTTDDRDHYGRLLASVSSDRYGRLTLCRHLIARHVCTPKERPA